KGRPGGDPAQPLVIELLAHPIHGLRRMSFEQGLLVVAEDKEGVVIAGQLQDGATLGTAVDQVADEGQAVPGAVEAGGLEEVEQLLMTALHVADEKKARSCFFVHRQNEYWLNLPQLRQ